MALTRFSLVTAAALVAAAAAATTTALANVDVEVDPKTKVKGTLVPEGEVDILRFDATAQTELTLVVVAKKKANLDFALELRDDQDALVDLGGAPVFKDKGKKVLVKKLVLPRSGAYVLRILGAGEGEYAAKLIAKPAKKVATQLTVPAGAQQTFRMPVPAGSKVVATAVAADGSPAGPRIDTVAGVDVSTSGNLGDASHSVTIERVATGGDVEFILTNRAATAGDVLLSLKVTPPKSRTLKLDLRDTRQGRELGGETVVSRTIDPTLGGSVSVDDALSDLAGVSVSIPGGALPTATRITLASTTQIAPPNPTGEQAAGPAVLFGPSGTQFAVEATITLRYDAAGLPLDTDPQTDLRAIRVQADGTTETITPLSVDENTSTMTIPASGFSRFMPFVPKGPPNLNGSSYWVLGMFLELQEDPTENQNSVFRFVDMDVGRVSFGPPNTDEAVQFDVEFRDVTIGHTPGSEGTVDFGASSEFFTGRWEPAGDSFVRLLSDVEGEFEEEQRFVASDDGRFLVSDLDNGNLNGGYLGVMVRRAAARPTLANLAGTYSVGYFSVQSEAFPPGPVDLGFERGGGTFTIGANGSARIQLETRAERFNPATRSFQHFVDRIDERGTASIISEESRFDGALAVSFDPNDPQAPNLVFFPDATNNVFIGTQRIADSRSQFFLVAVRQSKKLLPAAAAGNFLVRGMDATPRTYDMGQGALPDFEVCEFGGVVQLDGTDMLRFADHGERCALRDTIEFSGVRSDFNIDPGTENFSFNLSKNGTFTIQDEEGLIRGALAPAAQFGFLFDAPSDGENAYGLELLVRPFRIAVPR